MYDRPIFVGFSSLLASLAFQFEYIEQQPVYDQVDWTERWDSGVQPNRVKISAFLCPSDGPYPDPNYPGNNYMVCGGALRNFYNTTNPVPASGIFTRRREATFATIRDGASNTVMASEILLGDNNDGSYNPKRDFSRQLPSGFDQFPSVADIESAGASCDSVASGDHKSNAGRQWMGCFPGFVAFNTVAPPNWNHVTCCSGGGFGYACDRDGIVPPRSFHPGGVNVAMGDASVRFVGETVDLVTWQYMGAREDGKPVELP